MIHHIKGSIIFHVKVYKQSNSLRKYLIRHPINEEIVYFCHDLTEICNQSTYKYLGNDCTPSFYLLEMCAR